MRSVQLALILILALLTACSGKNGTAFPSEIRNTQAAIQVLNSDGFIGVTVANVPIEYTVTLMSAGGLSADNLSVTLTTSDPISFKGGSYPGTGGTCGTALESGQSCTMVFLYEPTTIASHRADLTFTYSDLISSYSGSFVLTGDSHPILNFEYGTQYDFGNKFIGSSTDLTIRISNIGKVSADSISINNLSLPFSYKGGSYPGTGGTCGTQLLIGQTCEIRINYSPTASGENLQDITFNYLNAGKPEVSTLHLLAWGFYPAVLTLSDSPGYDFGSVSNNAVYNKTFTLTHVSGDVAATNISVSGLASPFSYMGSFPGPGGTCGTQLDKQSSCTIVIALASATSGTWSNNLTFSYLDGVQTQTFARSLTAITKDKASLSFSPTSWDFGLVHTGNSVSKTFTVSYDSGELPVTSLNLVLPAGPYSRTGGTCGTTLTSGTCTIQITYNPTSTVSVSQNGSLQYNDGQSIRSDNLPLSGTTEAGIQFSDSSPVDFGSAVVGQSLTKNLTVSFVGGSAATSISSVSLTGPFSYAGSGSFPGGGTCTSSLSSGSCTVGVKFTPSAQALQTGQLTLSYNDGTQVVSFSVNLKGTGTAPATLSMSGGAFGSAGVNSATAGTITVTNSSSMYASSLNVPSLPTGFVFKGGTYPGTGGTCGTTLSGSSSCTMIVLFEPTSAIAYSGNLSLSYNDGASAQSATQALSGTGVATASLYISDFDTVDMGTAYIGQSIYQTFTLSHGGSGTAATGISISTSPSGEFFVSATTCGSSLSSGASCTITVRFSPTAINGRNANLVVSYNNGSAQSATRAISGHGVQPGSLAVSPTSYDFGNQATGFNYTQSFTVTATGSVTSLSGSLTGSGFSFAGGSYPGTGGNCATSLNQSTCTVVVQFSPATPANYSGTLSLSYNNGYTTQSASANLTGVGNPTSQLAFSSSSYDFGQLIQSQTSTQTITLTHSGPVAATGINATALSSPFAFKGGSYPGTGGTCSTSLDSGASCTMVINFTPTSTGTKTQTLTLNFNNGTSTQAITTTLTGKAVTQAIIGISGGTPYNFGSVSVGASVDATWTLTNGGGTTGTSLAGSFDNSAFAFKGGSFPGTGGTCATSLASGASCTIVVTFAPASSGSTSALMTLNYADGLRTQSEIKQLQGSAP